MRYGYGEPLDDCSSCSSHFGGNIDISDLQITFWIDRSNNRLDIMFEDIQEGHSEEQLAALKNHLTFILDQAVCETNSTVATLDERCRAITTVELCESFYANRREPIAAGLMQWSRCCDFLVRLVHSNTWVGSGSSPFAISKVRLVGRVVGISKLEHIENSLCAKAPGTVLTIDETAWHVAAADGVVKISNFLNEFGQPISAQTLADQCHIIEGTQLPIITLEQGKRFGMSYAAAMPSEPYWSQYLANFEPCQLSFVQSSGIQSTVWAASAYQTFRDVSAIEILAAWLIYISRDTQMSQIQIGWDATEGWHKDNEASSACTFAKTVPFSTSIDLNNTFPKVVASVEKDYKQLVNNLPCLSDTLIRHSISSTYKPWTLAISLINIQTEPEYSMSDACELALHAHGGLMTLQINKHNDAFRWIYDTNQATEAEVNQISTRLLILLESAHSAEEANTKVAKLNLLPKTERDLLLYTWNQATVTHSPDSCLHQLFEAQAERNGKAIAVECNGEIMSYAELNVQANRLAHYLIVRGIKPDDLIALCVERSLKSVVAFLGILKSGGAYVPLDPVYSSQRLTNILHDADPLCLLVDSTGRKALGDHQVPMVDLDEALPDDLSIDNPDPSKLGLTPSHLAYVIYTSGSTGTPKGVMVEHQSICNLAQTVSPLFGVTPSSRVLQFASCCFDTSLEDIATALTSGACLCLPNEEVRRTDRTLLDYLNTEKITHAELPPALLHNIQNPTDLKGLQALILSGEAPALSLLRTVAAQTKIINSYGPTEATITATNWICPADFDSHLIPIGRPLPNTRVYLLDAYGEPVPLGAEGELYIGGVAVARGYLNRPELTAERFLLDPFCETPAARMYRTGDRARYLPDGNLVYLGRTDQQIKIRGFRIEPGEIEAHLFEHPQVHEAVVKPFGNGSDASRLVAYVVAEQKPSLSRELRNYLLTLLPYYMVPAVYVCLPSLPLTPNGKIDRRALPAPDDEAFVRQQYEAPQNEMEETLADLWRELLGVERISRHDNFFELGGHSLLVMQIVNKAKLCNIHLNARGVYSFPILKDLAQQITERSNRLYCDTAIPVRRYENEAPLFLLPDGEGDASYAFELTHGLDKNIPVYVLPWSSPENKQPSSMGEMANAMIFLMKQIQTDGPYAIASYCGGGILAYEIAKQLTDNGDDVSFLGLISTYPIIANSVTETAKFLLSLQDRISVFKKFDDSVWWDKVSKLSLEEAIEEINKTYIDLKNIDIEWEALISKQQHNYNNLCAAYKIVSIPIKTHLFKAVDGFPGEDIDDSLYSFPKLGWENYNLSTDFYVTVVDGDHLTMMTDSKNRSLLGKKLSKFLQTRTET